MYYCVDLVQIGVVVCYSVTSLLTCSILYLLLICYHFQTSRREKMRETPNEIEFMNKQKNCSALFFYHPKWEKNEPNTKPNEMNKISTNGQHVILFLLYIYSTKKEKTKEGKDTKKWEFPHGYSSSFGWIQMTSDEFLLI